MVTLVIMDYKKERVEYGNRYYRVTANGKKNAI